MVQCLADIVFVVRYIDLSRIDFERGRKAIAAQKLRGRIAMKLAQIRPKVKLTKHEKLVLNWRQRQNASAMVRFTICGEWKTGEHAGCPRVS